MIWLVFEAQPVQNFRPMDPYALVKLLHLFAVVAAFAAATILHVNLARVKKAEHIPQAREALASAGRVAPLMPLFSLALFLTGVYLTTTRWTWAMPWIRVSVAGLVSMLVVSVAILKPRTAALARSLAEAGDGPLTDALRAPARDPLIGAASHFPTIMAATIMVLMTMKPGFMACLIAIGVAIVLSIGASMPMTKK